MQSLVDIGAYGLPWYLVPVLIFLARIVDVSMGTIRIIIVSRGMRMYASLLGFVEILIWLVAISQVLRNMDGWYCYIAYSAGFGAGTYVGMTIDRKFRMGMSLIQIVVPKEESSLVDRLIEHGHRITHLEAQGARGPVEVIFSIVKRKALSDVLQIIEKNKPDAFYSVEDVRMVKNHETGQHFWHRNHKLLQPFYWFRKSK